MSLFDADRNLLFGVLALQDDLIDARQFADACALWVLRKETPLADVLVERRMLTPAERRQVEERLQRKLKQHNGDARASLVAEVNTEAREALRTVDDTDVQDSVAGLTANLNHDPIETLFAPHFSGRYTHLREHAKGGLGRVYVAHDTDLNREVALKEILPRWQDNRDARRRFIKEAQITGLLDHPNIVPVYELTRRKEDDAPFYTMRFVDGPTLKKAIEKDHQRRAEGTCDPLERQRLLQAFIGVCNALGYAHSKKVVHRDLKPVNVNLGRYGQVVVLDWGMAKRIDQPDEDDEVLSTIGLTDDTDWEGTRAGSYMGTPAYMAPEQAQGRLDLVNARTDIYGLGAILFEILTGRAPHIGSSSKEQLERAANDPTPRASEANPSVPPALDAICAKAMARSAADRYRRAKDLARDVQRWLADEPVSVHRDDWSRRLFRLARKHRKTSLASAAVLMIVAVFFSIATVRVYQADCAKATALQKLETALQKLETEHQSLETEHQKTQQAFKTLASMFDDLDPVTSGFEGKSADDKLLDLVRSLDTLARNLENEVFNDELQTVAQLHHHLGRAQMHLRAPKSAIVWLTSARKKREESLGIDDPDTLITTSYLARAYQADKQFKEALQLYKRTLEMMKEKLPDHPETLNTMSGLASVYEQYKKDYDLAEQLRREVLKYRAALPEDDHDRLAAQAMLGRCLLKRDQHKEAESFLRPCLVIREQTQPDDWRTCATRSMLGESLLGQERYAEAEPYLLKGYEGLKQQGDKIPQSARIIVTDALERIVHLYEAWDDHEEAAKWRWRLAEAELQAEPHKVGVKQSDTTSHK